MCVSVRRGAIKWSIIDALHKLYWNRSTRALGGALFGRGPHHHHQPHQNGIEVWPPKGSDGHGGEVMQRNAVE